MSSSVKSIKKIITALCALCLAASAIPAFAVSADVAVSQSAVQQPVSQSVPQQPPSGDPRIVPGPQLPEGYERIFELFGKADEATLISLREKVADAVSRGDIHSAGAVLGVESMREFNSSEPQLYIGTICAKYLHGIGAVREQAKFLAGFIAGFRGAGVVMVPYEGTAKFFAYKNQDHKWASSETGGAAGRIFKGKDCYFVPFKTNETFKIDIYGVEGTEARLWKMLPDGVKSKSWAGGNWEREITVVGK